jgi:hypothetical protein
VQTHPSPKIASTVTISTPSSIPSPPLPPPPATSNSTTPPLTKPSPPTPSTVSSSAVEMSLLKCAKNAWSTQPKSSPLSVQGKRSPLSGMTSAWYATPTSSIFSTVAVRPRIHLLNTQNITEQDRFNRLLNTTMTEPASQASNVPTGAKKFGVKKVKFSEFQDLYNLVQCTPDLSSTDCNSCLQAAINRLPICCGGKQGGRALFPSCNVRYELYKFYNESTAPAPAPPPAGSVAGSKGKVLDHSFLCFSFFIIINY